MIELVHVGDCWEVRWDGHVEGWIFDRPPLDPLAVIALECAGALVTTRAGFCEALIGWLAHNPNAVWKEK